MSLSDWQKNGWLVEHRATPGEISGLRAAVDRDLKVCATPELDTDWRFNIAYNAALQTATMALAAAGYRAVREMHHFRVIHSLSFSIGADAARIDLLDRFRKKRNIGTYEQAGVVSNYEAEEMHRLAKTLREQVLTWIGRTHPDLIENKDI
jgi:hypothetical protein